MSDAEASNGISGTKVIEGMKQLVSDIVRPRRALVMDDEKLVRSVMAGMLAQLGFHVTETGSCAESKACCLREFQHVAFFDFRMDESVNGVECLLACRILSPKTQFVLWTGYADDATLQGLLKDLGWLTVLRKPTGFQELKDLLRTMNI